ncbi:MAG: glycosyltransferase [Planctomycetes bacterium]|nr:glycosyltransferase [Planctomycetota bacterium]
MRVWAFGAYEVGPGYPRARALLAGLRAAGCEVVAMHREPRPDGAARRRAVRAPWRWPGLAVATLRQRRALRRLLRAELSAARPDVLLLPYPAQAVATLAREAFDGPIAVDLLLPVHDAAVVDRRWFAADSLAARALRWLDRRVCASADLVLLDTPQHAARAAVLTGLPASRFAWVPVSDPDEGPPQPLRRPRVDERLRLLFAGTGVPLHGLEVLLEAVARTPGVELVLVGGSGADRRRARLLPAGRLRLEAEFVPRARLGELLDEAHAVAGVFGASPKTQWVVPFKVVHGLAAGRPVLTADTPAARTFLRPGADSLLVPAADVPAVQRGLEELMAARARLPAMGAAALATYRRSFSLDATGARLAGLLAGLAGVTPPARLEAPPVAAAEQMA